MIGENEQVADLLYDSYVKDRDTRLPSLQQEDWFLLIDSNREDERGLVKAKRERRKIVDKLNEFLDRLIKTGEAPDVTEMRRSEIIGLAIKKLVERRKIIEKRFTGR